MKKIMLLLTFLVLYNAKAGTVHLGKNNSFANIQAAAATIKPGDTVFLHSGLYEGYQIISRLKGTPEAPILITRYFSDDIEIRGGWQFVSCEHIKFLNLNFQANEQYPGRLINVDNGGSCETRSRFIVFDSCSFSGVTDTKAICALKFGGVDDFEVRNCSFTDNPGCDAMDFNVCHRGLISNNQILDCLSGGHIKGGSSGITMERNLFFNAAGDGWVAFELGGDTGDQFYCPGDDFEVKDLNFYSNIVAGGYRGLALSSARDCRVINNTFYDCGQATFRLLTTSHKFPALAGNVIENNLFAFGDAKYFNGSPQPANAAKFDRNIYYGLKDKNFAGPYWDSPALDSVKESNPMVYGSETPMFGYPDAIIYALASGSPALGAGKPQEEPRFDFLGRAFSQSTRSIGAIEFLPLGTKDAAGRSCKVIYAPENKQITVWAAEAGESQTVIVYDILGNSVCSRDFRGAFLSIDASALASGAYFVIVRSGKGESCSKGILVE